MDAEHARELLARERARIERELAGLQRDGLLEGGEQREPGELGSENLYEDELAVGRREQLRGDLEAIDRAEARLAAGAYGLSVESGQPIPDGRLEALPAAERTVEEEERRAG